MLDWLPVRQKPTSIKSLVVPSIGQPIIEIRNLDKSYRTLAGDYPALRDVNLTITAGEFAVIFGKSGAGKSTLMNMITGIDRPTSGSIQVCGVDLQQLGEDQTSRWRGLNVGVVFQFFQLFPTLTVIENVVAPMDFCGTFPTEDRYERAMYLLEQVDIAEHARKLPTEISGGQQQRLAIARALANDPQLIVADEPTGNLDSKTAQRVYDLFEDVVGRGHTLVVVSHDEDVARRASHYIEIRDGRISRDEAD